MASHRVKVTLVVVMDFEDDLRESLDLEPMTAGEERAELQSVLQDNEALSWDDIVENSDSFTVKVEAA